MEADNLNREAVIEELAKAGIINPENLVSSEDNIIELRPSKPSATSKYKVYWPKEGISNYDSWKRDVETTNILLEHGIETPKVISASPDLNLNGRKLMLPNAEFEFAQGALLEDLLNKEFEKRPDGQANAQLVHEQMYKLGRLMAELHFIPVSRELAEKFPGNIRGHEGPKHLRKLGVKDELIKKLEFIAGHYSQQSLCVGDAAPKNFVWDGEKYSVIDKETFGVNNFMLDIAGLKWRLDCLYPGAKVWNENLLASFLDGYLDKLTEETEKHESHFEEVRALEKKYRETGVLSEEEQQSVLRVFDTAERLLHLNGRTESLESYIEHTFGHREGLPHIGRAFELAGKATRKSQALKNAAMDSLDAENAAGVKVEGCMEADTVTEVLPYMSAAWPNIIETKDYTVLPLFAVESPKTPSGYTLCLAVYKKQNNSFTGIEVPARKVADGYAIADPLEAEYNNELAVGLVVNIAENLKRGIDEEPGLEKVVGALRSTAETLREKKDYIAIEPDMVAILQELGNRTLQTIPEDTYKSEA
jgi:hypothetical protein